MNKNLELIVFMKKKADSSVYYFFGKMPLDDFIALCLEYPSYKFFFKVIISGILREDKFHLAEKIKNIIDDKKKMKKILYRGEIYPIEKYTINKMKSSWLDMPNNYFLSMENTLWIHFPKEKYNVDVLLKLQSLYHTKKESIPVQKLLHIITSFENYTPSKRASIPSNPLFIKKDNRYFLINGLSSLINLYYSSYNRRNPFIEADVLTF